MAAAACAQTNAGLPSPTASCSYLSTNQPGCRDVVGFRAPYFKLNGALGAALQDSSFLWDSSISGKDPHQPAAPMHAFNLSACAAAGCGNWSRLSIWCGPAGCSRGLGAAAAAELWAPHVCTGWGAYTRRAAALVTLNNTCRLLLVLAGRCLHTRCPARADKPFGGSTLHRCPACQCWRWVVGLAPALAGRAGKMREQLWSQWSRPLLVHLVPVLRAVCLQFCNQAVIWLSHPAAAESRL